MTVFRTISEESLIIGALEAAFWDTDQKIGEEKKVSDGDRRRR